jgi:hypothetical protein
MNVTIDEAPTKRNRQAVLGRTDAPKDAQRLQGVLRRYSPRAVPYCSRTLARIVAAAPIRRAEALS